ncbi:hypothetical protein FB451DRAFT_1515993 [Mycena latifolia]|nr:hypothetical protein FB451DRAFT_1515993 [Mycena latifolia]
MWIQGIVREVGSSEPSKAYQYLFAEFAMSGSRFLSKNNNLCAFSSGIITESMILALKKTSWNKNQVFRNEERSDRGASGRWSKIRRPKHGEEFVLDSRTGPAPVVPGRVPHMSTNITVHAKEATSARMDPAESIQNLEDTVHSVLSRLSEGANRPSTRRDGILKVGIVLDQGPGLGRIRTVDTVKWHRPPCAEIRDISLRDLDCTLVPHTPTGKLTASVSKAQKGRAILLDLAIKLGIPYVQMPLRASSHPHNIVMNVGCYPTPYNVVPAYSLCYLWPIVISPISGTYSILILHPPCLYAPPRPNHAVPRRLSLTPTRCFRLPPHGARFARVPPQYPLLHVRALPLRLAQLHRALDLLGGHARGLQLRGAGAGAPLAHGRADAGDGRAEPLGGRNLRARVFAFFGFAAEARKNYHLAFWVVATRCGVEQPADGKLPIHLPWVKAKSSSAAASALPASLPRTPVK